MTTQTEVQAQGSVGTTTAFNVEKAHGSFLPVARWLDKLTPKERLCFRAGLVLHMGDTQDHLKANELYDGDVGTDLHNTFRLEDLQDADDPETRAVTAYLAGLEAAY